MIAMKRINKILSYGLVCCGIAATLTAFTACSDDVDNVFGDSAANLFE